MDAVLAGLIGLGESGLLDVLVEGGAGISASLWEAGLVDHGIWYVAGKIAGGIGLGVFDRPFSSISQARSIEVLDVRHLDPDLRIDWRPRFTDEVRDR